MPLTKEAVMEKLKEVTDPEMHIDIVELGLVYEVKIDKGMVVVDMTLTSPACPVGPMILEAVEESIKKLDGVEGVTVNVVWEPLWSPDKMTAEAPREANRRTFPKFSSEKKTTMKMAIPARKAGITCSLTIVLIFTRQC